MSCIYRKALCINKANKVEGTGQGSSRRFPPADCKLVGVPLLWTSNNH